MKKWFFGSITILLLFIFGAGIVAVGTGLSSVSAPAIWRARGEYEIMAASAEAVRSQTFRLNLLSTVGSMLLVIAVAAIIIGAVLVLAQMMKERRLQVMLMAQEQQHNKSLEQQEFACLPNDIYACLPAPKRENIHTSV